MTTATRCPSCGAAWTDDQTCEDHFHVLLAWELDHQLYDVHHLTVLVYYLQHPQLYSPEALRDALTMLVEFVEQDIHPHAMRERIRAGFTADQRTYKIKGTSAAHGVYTQPVDWTMHTGDVVQAGVENFYASVRHWADATLKSLRAAGQIT